jgi:hypothetical protein
VGRHLSAIVPAENGGRRIASRLCYSCHTANFLEHGLSKQ